MKHQIPAHFRRVKKDFPALMDTLEKVGAELRKSGPLDEKTIQLIQVAAAVAIQSEGAVHSHTRRAIEAGAYADEIRHAVILLTGTIGFPLTMAGLSWVNDVLDKK